MGAGYKLPRYIFGLHEPGGEWLMEEKGKPGWIVFTHGLGHDPNDHNGLDYRRWSERGFGIIARLNHGYGTAGTIPLPQHYDAFALRVRNFVASSPGCHVWIIGNEMNHGQERPEGQPITPDRYAACYKKCWEQIHNLPGHEEDQVAVGAVAPWNNTTAYPGNESGDWVRYFLDILNAIRSLGCQVDAITLHTYTHGHDPALVFSEQKMNPPFHNYHYNFRCYRDFMRVIPPELRSIPVYITETDEDEPWENANRGWVQNAYKEIDDWNTTPGNQQIRALVLYRWPKFDKWHIEGKTGVYDDFRAAMEHEYVWREVRTINGHAVQGAFLDFYEQVGADLCGAPLTDMIVEDGLQTQYFERVVMQLDPSGKIRLKKVGVEVQRLRQSLTKTQKQVQQLSAQVKSLSTQVSVLQAKAKQVEQLEAKLHALQEAAKKEPESGAAVKEEREIVRPLWETVVYQLPRHSTKRYALRAIGDIKYVVIHHSAVPATVTAAQIAKFHVKNMGWPGIGYHFYIDGQGRIFHTNHLTTVCYHVGEYDQQGVGICVGGNFTKTVPTMAQVRSAAHLVAWLLQELGLPLDAVRGHKEFIDTQCPGYQWLAGQLWKNTLLAEVKMAQSERVRSHPPKPFYHYMLFWQYPDAWAEDDWYGAREYIGRFRVTHGFSVDDAKVSRFVTIVGGPMGVDRKAEQILIDAGCRVERIAGNNSQETALILTEMAQRGQRFLNFAG